VKANPAPELLSLLVSLGSCFDTASVAEIELVLAAGATADRISYGNTIKKERDIARAFALGVRLFAVDCRGGHEFADPRVDEAESSLSSQAAHAR
jgi:ornithine decarboxylase